MQPTRPESPLMSEAAFYQELKASTHLCHHRLESKIPLLDPQLVLATYHNILNRFYGIYAAFDDVIDRVICKQLPFSPSLKDQLGWLEQDLRALGEDADRLAGIPRCPALPFLTTRSELLGVLYVFNGATLGSQFILESLRASLGHHALDCTRFFQSYGDQVKPRWNAFLEVLIRTPDSPLEQQAIIQSACDTFSCFEKWFDPCAGSICDTQGKDRSFV